MAGSRSSDLYASLATSARIAAIGAVAVPLSMLFPWYGITFLNLSRTGFDSFGLGQLALLITVGAVLVLIVRCAGGYRPPRPLTEGSAVIAGGVWSALLVGYLMIDRPDKIAGFERIHLRYGIFIALGGAVAMIVGGIRLRQVERHGVDPGTGPTGS